MKTKLVAVLLTLMFSGVAALAQEQSKSHQHQAPAKTEKSSEIAKPSSEPCCPEMKSEDCCQTDKKTEKKDHSTMDHSKMDTKENKKDVSVVYTCPMHSEVKSDKPGKCPKCGMNLIKKK